MSALPENHTEVIRTRALGLVRRFLDPDDLGFAVTPEVRDLAREVFGMQRTETAKRVPLSADDRNRQAWQRWQDGRNRR